MTQTKFSITTFSPLSAYGGKIVLWGYNHDLSVISITTPEFF